MAEPSQGQPLDIFVYGTLMRGGRWHQSHLTGAELLSSAQTGLGYALLDIGPYPAMVRHGTGRVVGELYRVLRHLLPALDELEEVPYPYQRQRITLADGVRAQAYIWCCSMEGYAAIPGGDWRRR